ATPAAHPEVGLLRTADRRLQLVRLRDLTDRLRRRVPRHRVVIALVQRGLQRVEDHRRNGLVIITLPEWDVRSSGPRVVDEYLATPPDDVPPPLSEPVLHDADDTHRLTGRGEHPPRPVEVHRQRQCRAADVDVE